MKLKKRLLAALLTFAFAFQLCPVSAFALDSVYPAITGPALGSANPLTQGVYYLLDDNGIPQTTDADASNYNVYYHDTTVTLNDAALKTPLYVPGGTTIEFLGTNSSGSETDKVTTAIQTMTDGDLTITGTGSYTAYASSGDGIITGSKNADSGDIIIEGGKLDLTNVNTSVNARGGNVKIAGSADIEARTLSAAKDITITGNAKITAQKIAASNKAVFTGDCTVNITNGGIGGLYGIEILGNAEVSSIVSSGNAINAFYGPVTINSTKKVFASSGDTRTATISAGVQQNAESNDLTICSEVEASGFLPFAVNGANSRIVVDGGTVTANCTFIGLYTQSAGNLEIKNGSKVTVTGSGNATPAIATYSRAPKPIIIEDSTITISNCGYGLSGSTITLKDSPITVDSTVRAFLATPTLDYTPTTAVLAGESADAAELVTSSKITADTFKNKYVKTVPAVFYSITLPTGCTAAVNDAQVSSAENGDDVVVTVADASALYTAETASGTSVSLTKNDNGTYSFTMPNEAVTISALYTLTLPKVENVKVNGEPAVTGTDANGNLTVTAKAGAVITFTKPADANVSYTFVGRDAKTELKAENGVYTVIMPSYNTTVEAAELPQSIETKDDTVTITAYDENNSLIHSAYAGAKVYLSYASEDLPEGTEFKGWKVTETDGTAVEVKAENGKYYFIMPDSAVTVELLTQPVKSDDNDKPTTPDKPEVKKSGITLPEPNDYGVAAKDADGKEISAAAKDDKVYLTYDDSTLPEDKMFDAWTVTGKDDTTVEVQQDENGKYYFEMPEGDVTITLKLKPINETPDTPADSTFDTVAAVAGGVTAGAAIGVAGYYAGTGLYLDAIFGYVPANRQALATALWTKANKPEPQSTALYTDVSADETDAQKADRWCVEQGLLPDKGADSFKPGAYVTRVQCIKSWKALEKLLNNN